MKSKRSHEGIKTLQGFAEMFLISPMKYQTLLELLESDPPQDFSYKKKQEDPPLFPKILQRFFQKEEKKKKTQLKK